MELRKLQLVLLFLNFSKQNFFAISADKVKYFHEYKLKLKLAAYYHPRLDFSKRKEILFHLRLDGILEETDHVTT